MRETFHDFFSQSQPLSCDDPSTSAANRYSNLNGVWWVLVVVVIN